MELTEPPDTCGSPDCDEWNNCDWPTCVGFRDRNQDLPGDMECCDLCARTRQTLDLNAQRVIHVILHREGPQIVPIGWRP